MKLMPTKHQRCAHDRKLLVPYDIIGYIRQKLEARNLMTFPHYRPILYTLQQRKSLCSPCQFHQLEYISQFSTDNIAANCQLEMLGSLVASISQQSQQLKRLVRSWTLITKTQKLAFGWHRHKLLCDTSSRNLQPFLPDPFPQQAFDSVHNLWHPGIKATTHHYVWLGICSDSCSWDHWCGACKLSKVDLHIHGPFGDFPVAIGGLMHAHVNIVNHFLTSDVQQYLLPIIEYFTLWPGATPISYISADTVALAFVSKWTDHYALLFHIPKGCERKFEFQLFKKLSKFFGTHHHHPAPKDTVQ
ncbi:uncharacterized protein LOC124778259 [Schistocerca piceifrons]|uniref:uncharacterized protein LOC124778259 n=1 Tax=Schistocerca piceifrons TaxID=274613 RepID=UPI001F5E7866|nr:uncharacterized protein LOC124778259 [Schistocerca piceifrons]